MSEDLKKEIIELLSKIRNTNTFDEDCECKECGPIARKINEVLNRLNSKE